MEFEAGDRTDWYEDAEEDVDFNVPYPDAEHELKVFSASSMAALTHVVTALLVACILSCKLLEFPKCRKFDDGLRYLTGETDPLIRAAAEGGTEDLTDRERDGASRLLDAPAESAVGLPEDRQDRGFTEEDVMSPVGDKVDLNGILELYMFSADFGEAGGVIVIEDLSSRDPAVVIDEVLEDNDDVNPLTYTESDKDFTGEDIRTVETGTGY